MNLPDKWFHARRRIVEFFEDQWFDRTHHVRTSGDLALQNAGIAAHDEADSELYVPARPAHIRQALQAAPVHDPRPYTFVDIGSGKGRALFVAAEFPFRGIVGVEFSPQMHALACRNARTFRLRKHREVPVQPLCMNAKDFDFPRGPLVLYLFNPFGAATMQAVLDRLQQSIEREPRHVVVILLWPRCGNQVARIPGMRRVCATQHHEIFEANAPAR